MRNKLIRVIIVEPNKEPYTAKIKNTLEEKQKIVGGLLYFYDIEHNVDLICNEESKSLNLDFNRIVKDDIICGTFIVSGQKNCRNVSLNRKQIQKYKKELALKNHKLAIRFLQVALAKSSNLLGLDLNKIEKLKNFFKKEE